MPVNAHPDFIEAQAEYEKAQTDEEKLKALEKMRSHWPKHKGAENLRADIAKRIKKLKQKLKEQKKQKKGTKGFNIKKEGAAQIIIIGLPNSGKSTLLKALSNAKPKISDYPFTTKEPEVGMLKVEEDSFQIVELPAIIEGSAKGVFRGKEKLAVIRNADLLFICLNNNAKEELKTIIKELENSRIYAKKKKKKIIMEKAKSFSLENSDKIIGANKESVINYIKRHFPNNKLKILEEISADELLKEVSKKEIPIIIFAKSDKNEIKEQNSIKVFYLKDFSEAKKIKNEIIKSIIDELELIRVYTRKPGDKTKELMLMKKNSNVKMLCERIHKELLEKFRFAKVWGKKAKFKGQIVSKDYVFNDNDIIEIYSKK